jgi:transposase
VAAGRLAGPFEKSADAGAVILLADEAGFMMTPTVKRTWARRGRTPVVPFHARRQKKVSALGAVALDAAAGRAELVCDFHPAAYVRGPQEAAFLHRVLAEHPGRPVDVVWDKLSAHRSGIVKEVLAAHPRLTLHYLPAYAPDLYPAEGAWALAKYHRMANHTICELGALHATAARHLGDIGRDQTLLASCFGGAGLALTLPGGH